MIKAIELAEYNQATAIAEQLEGFVRDLTRNKKNSWGYNDTKKDDLE